MTLEKFLLFIAWVLFFYYAYVITKYIMNDFENKSWRHFIPFYELFKNLIFKL